MVDITRTVIRLGNFSDGIADIDPDGVNDAEGAGTLVGQSFTSATMSTESITYSDGNDDGFVDFDSGVGPGGDYVTYDLGGGPVSEAVDQSVWYNVDILLGDGSTLSTSALIFQTPSGETFLTEFASSLDNLDIQSITPTAVNNSFFGRISTSNAVENTTVCFGRRTAIWTPDGARPVEGFAPGDLVATTDGVAQPVVAVYRIPAAAADRDGAPVRFDTGTLGAGAPFRPLLLTGNHRVLCASRLVERMFGQPEVLMPAKRFTGLPGVTRGTQASGLDFYHLELKTHSVIWANGALVESCLLGPVAARGLPGLPSLAALAGTCAAPRYPVPPGHTHPTYMRRVIANGHAVVEDATYRSLASRLGAASLARCC